MSFLILYNDNALLHKTLPGHPETVSRYESLKRLFIDNSSGVLKGLSGVSIEEGSLDHALLAHSGSHVEKIRTAFSGNLDKSGYIFLESDTPLMSDSIRAIEYSLYGAIEAIDYVMATPSSNSFSIQRPPGHHAESNRAMGFCFFNNAACAAIYAQREYNVDKVAVIDFDVHHGNGTQEIFWSRKGLYYLSTHQSNYYPGTGSRHDFGKYKNICNVPLKAGCSSSDFRAAYEEIIFPALDNYRPDIVIISAGFDAHIKDPLGGMDLSDKDFEWVTLKICDYADKWSNGRVVSLLEGGYNLDSLCSSALCHVKSLMQLG